MKTLARRSLRTLATAALLPWILASCGGGGDGGTAIVPASCSVADQNAWLAGYFDDWYFWYRDAPRPSPGAYATVDDFFNASLYTGTNPSFPADRWSFSQSTESFNRFFGDGQSLGYGVSVNGVEVGGDPTAPLYVRYVEPLSPAGLAGVVRGDQVLSINGVSAASVIAADDYSALTASSSGQALTLVLRNTGGDRSVTLTSAVYSLSPVPQTALVATPGGRTMGYVVVKDMISQVQPPLETAFAQFKAAGVQDVVLDLRYNGGGLVSVGAVLASYVAGGLGTGHVYAGLLYNARHPEANQYYRFGNYSSAAGVPRVYVLTGPRTCSAAEQVMNGLLGIGIDVVAIGDTTCGKPVGFLPVDGTCGTTYNVVNFESVNEQDEGRYFDGFEPTCVVDENFTRALGSASEPLLAAAANYADTGSCPLPGQQPLAVHHGEGMKRRLAAEPGEVRGMIAR